MSQAQTHKIPKPLQPFHGERASLPDILLTYAGALLAGITLWYLSERMLAFPALKQALLTLLALDIGGGLVANFTAGTNAWYRERPQLRLYFIALHVFHVMLLGYLFPGHMQIVLGYGFAVLVATFVVNAFANTSFQKALAGLLVLSGLCALPLLQLYGWPLNIMLMLLMLKMVLAFPVQY